MSWLKNVAGKAENLLNTLDQQAEDYIQHAQQKDLERARNNELGSIGGSSRGISPSRSLGKSEELGAGEDISNLSFQTQNSMREQMSSGYLERVTTSSPMLNVPIISNAGSRRLSRDSNNDSEENSALQLKIPERSSMETSITNKFHAPLMEKQISHSRTNSDIVQPAKGSEINPAGKESFRSLRANSPIPMSASNPNIASNLNSQASTFEISVLKSEVDGMNKELSRYLDKCNSYEKDLATYQGKCRSQNEQLTKTTIELQNYKELSSNQTDELKYLRNELKSKSNLVADLTKKLDEKVDHANELMMASTHATDLHNTTFETLQEKMDQLERNLREEQHNKAKLEVQLDEEKQKILNERTEFSKNINEKELQLESDRRAKNNLSIQNKQLKSQLDTVQQELEDYKAKAQRILQSKERLIDNLKSSADMNNKSGISQDGKGYGMEDHLELTDKLDELLHEKEDYKHEIHKLKAKINDLEIEYSDLDSQTAREHDQLLDRYNELKNSFELERSSRSEAEKEVSRLRKKTSDLQENITRNKHDYTNRIQERDSEVCRLRNQLLMKNKAGTNQSELEDRVHSLTSTVLEKQNQIETLLATKHSMSLQLEKAQEKLNEAQIENDQITRATSGSALLRNRGGPYNSGAVPVLIEDDELRTDKYSTGSEKLTKKAKQTLRTIDIFSIRIGVFLRKYPIARVFIIFYGLLLHIWVLVILLVDEPEVHNPGEAWDIHQDELAHPNVMHIKNLKLQEGGSPSLGQAGVHGMPDMNGF